MGARSTRPANGWTLACVGVAAALSTGDAARAGSARDYLNAPVDTWLLNYNAGCSTSLTPEDGADLIPGVRSNVFANGSYSTRIYWGRTGGFSLVLPYALVDSQERRPVYGVSDVGFTWQMNIFGGPTLSASGSFSPFSRAFIFW